MAIVRLLLGGASAPAIAERVRNELAGSVDLDRLRQLRDMIDSLAPDHANATTPADVGALFDRAVAASPEASVALYSLGDPQRLRAATEEIVAWLLRMGLVEETTDVLDLGCGIGRMALALSPAVRSVTGVDVSGAMVREAERRCGALPNIRFRVTDGGSLAAWPDNAFDLILAVDSFPYLVQAGVAERHMGDGRRVLRSRGDLVILNLSYRGDDARDRQDALGWAERHGFSLREAGRPFRLWDGAAWLFHRI